MSMTRTLSVKDNTRITRAVSQSSQIIVSLEFSLLQTGILCLT